MADLVAALPRPGGVAASRLTAVNQRGGETTNPEALHVRNVGEVVPVEYRVGVVVDYVPGVALELGAKEFVAIVISTGAVEARLRNLDCNGWIVWLEPSFGIYALPGAAEEGIGITCVDLHAHVHKLADSHRIELVSVHRAATGVAIL